MMGRGWKSLKFQARKSVDCHNYSVKDDSGQGSQEEICRDYLDGLDQNVGRNIDGKDNSEDISGRNKEQGTGNGVKAFLVNTVPKNQAESHPHPGALCKAEFKNN